MGYNTCIVAGALLHLEKDFPTLSSYIKEVISNIFNVF